MTNTQTTCPNRIAFHARKKGTHPAEVGALASVFEKSATELKQKLLKCKLTTYIQQLCGDTGCSLKNMPKAMDSMEVW